MQAQPIPENAFRQFWNLGYSRLVPITPPDADISPYGAFASRMRAGGDPRGKAPGAPGKDGWHGLDFVRMESAEGDLDAWHSWGAGVGIKTGEGLIAVDVDTTDKLSAIKVHELAQLHLGVSAVRFGRHPKCLLVYDGPVDMPYRKVQFSTPTEDRAAVEILTEGRQFVAHGVHPGTRKAYRWVNDRIPRRDALTHITHEKMDAFLAAVAAAFPNAKRIDGAASSGGEHDQDELRAPDYEALASLVEATPNTSVLFPDRQTYVTMACAIKAAAPHGYEDAARDLWLDWCDRWEDPAPGQEPNDPEIAMQDWNRAKPPFRVGYSWIMERAALRFLAPVSQEEIDLDDMFASHAEATGDAKPAVPPLKAGRITLDDLDALPPRQWLYGRKVSRGYVTFVASPGGTGKTAWVTAAALACATGEALLHDAPRPGPLKVWIMNLEDDLTEMRRRLKAAITHYALDPACLDNLRVNSGRDRRFTIVRQTKDGFVVEPDYKAVIDEMRAEHIDILIVDPFLRSHRVSENDNEAQDEVMRLYAQIAHETQAGVVLIHHTKKGGVSGDMDSLRGGSTQGAGARSVLTLAPMSPEEAKRLGIDERLRRLHVRVDDAKNNMAPPAARAEWFKLHSVALGNGSPDYPEGDSVQVAGEYTPPSMWEGRDSEQDDAEALALIDKGTEDGERFSARVQDESRWAGSILVEHFGRTKEQASEIVKTWQRLGLVEIREYRSEAQRKNRKGLFVNWVGIDRPEEPAEGVFD